MEITKHGYSVFLNGNDEVTIQLFLGAMDYEQMAIPADPDFMREIAAAINNLAQALENEPLTLVEGA